MLSKNKILEWSPYMAYKPNTVVNHNGIQYVNVTGLNRGEPDTVVDWKEYHESGLVSGENIRKLSGKSILGSGDLVGQYKYGVNTTLLLEHSESYVIATAGITITVPNTFPDGFRCTVLAESADVEFVASSGVVFKMNGGSTTLKAGGVGTLIKENGTNNYYLTGNLS